MMLGRSSVMRGTRVRAVLAVLMCNYATVGLSACSEPVVGDDVVAANPASRAATAQAAATGCLTRTAGAGFDTTPVTPLSRFALLEFTATASDPDLDGVIGLTSGSTTGFDRLA